jgi:uncharacterized protein
VDSLYSPHRSRKTLASAAIAKGLLPLAQQVLALQLDDEELEAQAAQHISEELELRDRGDVLEGVKHIIAEMLSDDAEVRPLCSLHLPPSHRGPCAAHTVSSDVSRSGTAHAP